MTPLPGMIVEAAALREGDGARRAGPLVERDIGDNASQVGRGGAHPGSGHLHPGAYTGPLFGSR
jgi:hypothetical protein